MIRHRSLARAAARLTQRVPPRGPQVFYYADMLRVNAHLEKLLIAIRTRNPALYQEVGCRLLSLLVSDVC